MTLENERFREEIDSFKNTTLENTQFETSLFETQNEVNRPDSENQFFIDAFNRGKEKFQDLHTQNQILITENNKQTIVEIGRKQ